MNPRSVRLVASACLFAGWTLASGCEGDPSKHAVYEGGGAGGEAGEHPDSMSAAGAGAAGTGGAAGDGPVEQTPDLGGAGGVPAAGGMPSQPAGAGNEDLAGATSMGGAPPIGPCEGELVFADQYFADTVRAAAGVADGMPLTSADVASLTELKVPSIDGTIKIDGIECLTALTSVDFSGNAAPTPLSRLASLPNLRRLDLSGDYLTNESIVGLMWLTQLTWLDLHDNLLTDFGPLAPLTELEWLDIWDNGDFNQTAADISALAGLVKLKTLKADFVRIADLQPLAPLTQLEDLSLKGAPAPDLGVLAGLTNLKSLNLAQAQITDIGDLAGLTKLTTLDLSYDELADFSPIAGLVELTNLNLASTKLSSLTVVAPLTKLTTLDVSYNQLTSATTLGALPALQWLSVSYNPLTSLAALSSSSYIGAGDEIFVEALDCQALEADFTALAAKGVTLHTSCN